jgi:hypothetical protein
VGPTEISGDEDDEYAMVEMRVRKPKSKAECGY